MSDAQPRESDAHVAYRSPILQRLFNVTKGCFVFALLGMVLAGIYWAAVLPALFASSPVWAHYFGGFLLLALAALTCWVVDKFDPTRLILNENDLWLGGRVFGRSFAYNDLRLIKQEKPEGAVGSARQLIIERAWGKPLTIWLKPNDADESFEALRSLREHAPAIDLEQQIHQPANTEFVGRAKVVLVADFRRKARRALWAAIGSTVVAAVVMMGLLMGGATGRNRSRGWAGVIVFPIAAIGSAAAYFDNRRRARELEQQSNPQNGEAG